jgi:two-component system, NtrC family, sensor histidine kinase GlrK
VPVETDFDDAAISRQTAVPAAPDACAAAGPRSPPFGDRSSTTVLRVTDVRRRPAETQMSAGPAAVAIPPAETLPVEPRQSRRWWMRCLPRTMTGMVVCSCLLAALPMLFAVIFSGLTLQRQAELGERLVAEALRLERLGAQLLKDLENLQRGTLQYIALEDAALLPVIERRRDSAETILIEIERSDFPWSVTQQAQRVRRGLDEADAIWAAQSIDVNELTRSAQGMRDLISAADAMVLSGRTAIDEKVRRLLAQMSEARRLTRISAIALVPLTALLALVFSVAVTRPLRTMRLGIVALGTSNYRQRVEIAYPREMSRLGEKLDWLRRRLALLEADKDRFLRHVSHELKTPLATIREGAGLLIDGTLGPLNDRQTEVLQLLFEATTDQERQIHNLIAYAQWRNGMQQVMPEWFSARAFIEDAIGAQRLPMSKRSLQYRIGAAQSCRLLGQRVHLRVALDNLISNAIKHAPDGSFIECAAECDAGRCRLSVRDFGRGIPEADRERFLEPFVRGDDREETCVRGTGVGLSIAFDVARAHGGDLEIQDANPGTRVLLSWPCPSLRS